jgi:hypothetical protein
MHTGRRGDSAAVSFWKACDETGIGYASRRAHCREGQPQRAPAPDSSPPGLSPKWVARGCRGDSAGPVVWRQDNETRRLLSGTLSGFPDLLYFRLTSKSNLLISVGNLVGAQGLEPWTR